MGLGTFGEPAKGPGGGESAEQGPCAQKRGAHRRRGRAACLRAWPGWWDRLLAQWGLRYLGQFFLSWTTCTVASIIEPVHQKTCFPGTEKHFVARKLTLVSSQAEERKTQNQKKHGQPTYWNISVSSILMHAKWTDIELLSSVIVAPVDHVLNV